MGWLAWFGLPARYRTSFLGTGQTRRPKLPSCVRIATENLLASGFEQELRSWSASKPFGWPIS
jgi:hypothetical protein